LTGTIASNEQFGVFVALDECPDHPVFPGVGFISYAELSWAPATDAVQVGQHVACEGHRLVPQQLADRAYRRLSM
jgi:hypothetical protein